MTSNQPMQHLPLTKGPYVTGCVDIMLDCTQSSLFFRLYYPTNLKPSQSDPSEWVPWLTDDAYLTALANCFGAPSTILRLARWWNGADNMHIPSHYGAKLHPDVNLNCVIWSHGFGGNRYMYSTICNEIASRGFLVVCIEHRDGSVPYTYYYDTKEDIEKDIRQTVPLKRIYFGYAKFETVREQVYYRADECLRLLDVLTDLNDKGAVPHNILEDVANAKQVEFKLEDLIGRIDMDNITMAGHSFGAATALVALSRRDNLKQGILMDPWMYPIKDQDFSELITQPLLFINSPSFHDKTSTSLLEKYLRKERRQSYTILQSTHVSHTDSVVVLGYWSNWFQKKLKPLAGLQICQALVLKFLREHVDIQGSIEDFERHLIEFKDYIEEPTA